MKPQARHFTASEIHDYMAGREADDLCRLPDEPGWYSRLSASGYLDCTEWSGPFDTEKEALEYIMNLFEVDKNGVPANE